MCGNHIHRNFTFPASARTAFIACDGVHNSPLGSFCLIGKSIAFQAIALFSHKTGFVGALNFYPLGLWLDRSIIICFLLHPLVRYTATPLSCALSLSRCILRCYHSSERLLHTVPFRKIFCMVIITVKPPSIRWVSKNFFEKVFDIFCEMTSSIVIITAKGNKNVYL